MHKRIGIIGGTTAESTIEYYRYMTRGYFQRFGDHGYPEIVIFSVSFQQYIDWMLSDRWDLLAQGLIEAAHHLQDAGADLVMIATNAMHLVFDEVQAQVRVPMVSMLEAVGKAIQDRNFSTVALLGARSTMEKAYYKDALKKRGIATLIPDPEDRKFVSQAIFEELSVGLLLPETRKRYIGIIEDLAKNGAEGVVLGCTE
ncbi:MAG: amino acid racemase, partial [Anaerolineales bacterium]|nr:amino acid racemase [Anaerolineales bacterium]